MKNLYPIVVPATYFSLPPDAPDIGQPSLDAFGIVRPIGNNLFSLLVEVNDDRIKNVHEDEMLAHGLDRAAAERVAIGNLSVLAESSETIQRQVNKTSSGFHFALWFGERLTSSCILWPGLYEWARRELETDQLIVSVPQVQLMCVAARGDEAFRDTMKGYMDKVIADMDRHISTDWFELAPNGLAELRA